MRRNHLHHHHTSPSSPAEASAGNMLAARAGMTLLEVLLALAIFLGAISVIGQLVTTGSRAAVDAQFKSEAAQRCESLMNEVVSGVLPLQSVSTSPFEDDPRWTWSINVAPGSHVDLLHVDVTVTRTAQSGDLAYEFSLVRWMRNPELFLNTTTETETL